MIVRYHIGLQRPARERAEAVLDLLLDGMGAAGRPVPDPAHADLVYAARKPGKLATSAIWVRTAAAPIASMTAAASEMTMAIETLSTSGPGALHLDSDLIELADFFVSGRAERLQPRNQFGVPLLAGPEASILRRPIVSELILALELALKRRVVGHGDCVKRWPAAFRAAFLLTHDVDQPYRRPTGSFYGQRIGKELMSGRLVAAGRAAAGWTKARISHGRTMPPGEDPNFGFAHWMEAERSLGGRGCFYVAVRSSADPGSHPSDVAYDASDASIVSAMRRAIAAGWEIGLHASIRCAEEPWRFAQERAQLESLLGGHPVHGVRHHYWALKPDAPHETWAAQRAAGFAYDSSLGINDAPGFRRGLAWPFQPLSPGAPLQVPPTLMDGGLFYANPTREDGVRGIRGHLQQVFSIGGAAVLDWHLEQSNATRLSEAGPALSSALDVLRGRSDIWIATPSEMAGWWKERQRLRADLRNRRDRIRLRRPIPAERDPSQRLVSPPGRPV